MTHPDYGCCSQEQAQEQTTNPGRTFGLTTFFGFLWFSKVFGILWSKPKKTMSFWFSTSRKTNIAAKYAVFLDILLVWEVTQTLKYFVEVPGFGILGQKPYLANIMLLIRRIPYLQSLPTIQLGIEVGLGHVQKSSGVQTVPCRKTR